MEIQMTFFVAVSSVNLGLMWPLQNIYTVEDIFENVAHVACKGLCSTRKFEGN